MDKYEACVNSVKNILNRAVNKKSVFVLCLIIFAVLLFPIVKVSFYTHPAADDFNYGVNTINKINDIGLWGVLGGALKTVVYYFKTWQGTFSAIFLFALSPSIWGPNCYFLTTIIILLALLLSLMYLFKTIMINCLKCDKYIYYICTIIFYLLSIETLPSINQGLYWWNGASYYMIFFSLELVLLSLLFDAYINKKRKKVVLMCLLSFIIGGGNFITALQQIIILFILSLVLIIFKKDKSSVLPFVFSLIGLGISALAPGNAYRAAGVVGMNPIKAIMLSFTNAYAFMFQWIKPISIISIIIIALLLIPYIKNIKFKFRGMLLVLIMSYCIFSAEFTPTLYSTSSIGEGRLWNIMYISLLLIILLNTFYFIGYILNRMKEKKAINNIDKTINYFISGKSIITIVSLILIGSLMYFDRHSMTSYITYDILQNGQAQKYDQEYRERQKILENKSIKKVEFEKYTYMPYPIFYVDYTSDKNHWLNIPVAEIYNKEYVIVKEELEEE